MVACSCCVYDGGSKEKEYRVSVRERGQKGNFTNLVEFSGLEPIGKWKMSPQTSRGNK